MECKEARFLCWFARPGRPELEADELSQLQHHLQECSECAAAMAAEQRLDTYLGEAVRDVPVPAGLQARLLNKLEQDRARRRWKVRALALAASLLLSGGLLFYWLAPRPAVNYEEIFVHVRHSAGIAPEDVEVWFKERGLNMVAPRQLNYRLLDSCDTVEIQGQRVPKLLFVQRGERRSAVAHVYVLSDQQFDLASRPPERMNISSHTIEERTFSDIPFVYLFVYTGESLDPFFADSPVN